VRIYKFGGASVKDAASVKNVADIIRNYPDKPSVVVLSAMGKMTNAFEKLALLAFKNDITQSRQHFSLICNYHLGILRELFPQPSHPVFAGIEAIFSEISNILQSEKNKSFDAFYDLLIPYGELLSTAIVSAFLSESELQHQLLDARKLILTDSSYRDARVRWPETIARVNAEIHQKGDNCAQSFVLTQGFIASDAGGNTTTLGREGSDYTAAILAFALDASEVLIWKDVPGLLNADPQIFSETVKIDRLSYADAIELAYYGAKIIHPKTIKPLQNKRIPLIIKSFNQPELPGSVISDSAGTYEAIPSYIFKFGQVLLSIRPRDFSFINEENLFDIFGIFTRHKVHINLMQNSAISFSVCFDEDEHRFAPLLEELQQKYRARYNRRLELITIRNYDEACVSKVVKGREILLEQRSRATVQLLVATD
jgi:aspartate kinase